MDRKELDRVILKTILLLVIAVLIIMHFDAAMQGLVVLIGFMSPIFLGFAIAFVINIIMVRLEKIYFPKAKNAFLVKSRRPVCIFLSLLIILLVIACVCIIVIPELIGAFTLLSHELSSSSDSIISKTAEFISRIPPLEEWLSTNLGIDLKNTESINWEQSATKLLAMIFGSDGSGKLGTIMDSSISIVSNIGGKVVRFFIALVFGIYALASKEKLGRQIKRLVYAYLRPKLADRIYHICGVANETFSNFIVGQCTEAVILGLLCSLGMTIFRFPYAPMIGTLVGATALIPVIGAYIGAIVGAFMVFTQGGPIQALLFVVFIIVLQQLEGNLIYPKVVGSSVGLPGIWVLAAVTIGASLNGVFGMLIGVPLAATIYRLIGEDSRKRLRKKNEKGIPLPTNLNEPEETTPPEEEETNDTPDTKQPEQDHSEKSDNADHLDTINQAFDEIVSALHQEDDSEQE